MIEKFKELVKQSPIATEKFINHCVGVFNILKDMECSEEVCKAGLYHSIYGTSYFDVTVQNVHRDRNLIKEEIGNYAESLVYEMCVLNDREDDILSGRVDWDLNFLKDVVTICLANLIDLQSTDGNSSYVQTKIFEYELLLQKLLKGINPFKIKNIIENDIKIFDDYLTESLKIHVWNFVQTSKYQYGHRSGTVLLRENSLRFSCYLNKEEVFRTNLYPIFKKLAKEMGQDIFIGGYYIGNYNRGTCAESHVDTCIDDNLTILIYPNVSWEESWGGDIKFYSESSKFNTCIDYVPGRIIIFDSKLKHKVMPLSSECPSNRFSMAFKCCNHRGLHKFLTHYSMDRIIQVSHVD